MKGAKGSTPHHIRTKEDMLFAIQYERNLQPPRPLSFGETSPVFDIQASLEGMWKDKKLQTFAKKVNEKKKKDRVPLVINNNANFPKTRAPKGDIIDEGPELSAPSPFDNDVIDLLSDGESKESSNSLGLL